MARSKRMGVSASPEQQERRDIGPLTGRGHARRAALLDAARRVFEERGFLDTRVADIAAEAKVAQGTFYTYFDSKDAIFQAVASRVAGDMIIELGASRPLSTASYERTHAAMRRYVESYRSRAKILALIEQVGTFTPEMKRIRLQMREAHVDRLARGIEHQQDFSRLHPVAQLDEFLHQRLVDLQPAGGVENDHVNAVRLGLGHRAVGDLEHVLFAAHQETRQIKLPGQGLDLVHRGGPVNVRADEQRFAILGGEQAGELAAGGGFAGAVQAAHHQAERLGKAARQVELAAIGTEQRDHFIADDFDDLLPRLDAGDDLLAERLFLHAGDELLGDLEIDVRIEQGHAHLAQCLGDVGFADLAEAPEVAEGFLEFIAERVKHGCER